jgi:topoisomerase IV subunit A
VLAGLIIAFLNLDRIIAIIRTEDEPKPVMMAEFALSDVQAEAILNTRLRSLRRLEEMELRAEHATRSRRNARSSGAFGSEEAQWSRIAEELRAVRKAFGRDAPGGARRTTFEDAPEVEDLSYEAMIEREPVTVVLSAMGWIRAMKGHLAPDAELKFKDGDGPGFLIHAETTDRILLMASNGRMYTLAAASLPGGRGMGEPVRLMVDMPNEAQPVAVLVHRPGGRLLVASSAGDGFVLPEDEAVAQTRAGRQVMNLRGAARCTVCRRVTGDAVAVVGENRKLLVFALSELPEMGRGKGVRLQRYKDGGLSDAVTFVVAEGLAWKDPAGRSRSETDLAEWTGARASAGRTAPRGFPRDNRFPRACGRGETPPAGSGRPSRIDSPLELTSRFRAARQPASLQPFRSAGRRPGRIRRTA